MTKDLNMQKRNNWEKEYKDFLSKDGYQFMCMPYALHDAIKKWIKRAERAGYTKAREEVGEWANEKKQEKIDSQWTTPKSFQITERHLGCQEAMFDLLDFLSKKK
jgi:hypothetical protein